MQERDRTREEFRLTRDEFRRVVRRALAQGVTLAQVLAAARTAARAHEADEASADADDAAGLQPW